MNNFVLVLLAVLTLCTDGSETSLIKNGDFETVNNGEWACSQGCTLTDSSDSYTGQHSMKISDRKKEFNGIQQRLDLVPLQRYKLTGYIKLLNSEAGTMIPKVQVWLQCKIDGVNEKIIVGRGPIKLLNRWNEVGGVFILPSGSSNCLFSMTVPGKTVIYLADNFSMEKVEYDPNWRDKADARIEKIRKANLSFKLAGANLNGIAVEIEQRRHKFGFGSGVKAEPLLSTDPQFKPYQDFFYDNFDWAIVFKELKWKKVEKVQGNHSVDLALEAIADLRKHGIKIRAHNVFWGISNKIQDWVLDLNATELDKAIRKRVSDVIRPTKGLLEQWVVNNENTHGDFYYEVKLNKPNITMDMFKMVKAEDPDTKLYLNDFGSLDKYDSVALKDQAALYKQAGDVPIYGIGIQCHTHGNIDFTNALANLDLLAEAGLPMWISELSVVELNVTKRASVLSDLLKLFFSYPKLEGVTLFGYWDGNIFDPNYALLTGPNFIENEAAIAVKTLLRQTWRTNESHSITVPGQVTTRGFLGEYKLRVKHNDKLIGSKTFQLDKNGLTVDITLTGDDTNPGDPKITFS